MMSKIPYDEVGGGGFRLIHRCSHMACINSTTQWIKKDVACLNLGIKNYATLGLENIKIQQIPKF